MHPEVPRETLVQLLALTVGKADTKKIHAGVRVQYVIYVVDKTIWLDTVCETVLFRTEVEAEEEGEADTVITVIVLDFLPIPGLTR